MTQEENMVVMLVVGLLPLFLLFVPLPFSQGLTPKDLAQMWSGNSGYLIVVGLALMLTSALLLLGNSANKITEKAYKVRGVIRKKGAGRHRINAIDALRRAEIYAQRVDYLICGDDGEESFHSRLKEELEKYEQQNKKI